MSINAIVAAGQVTSRLTKLPCSTTWLSPWLGADSSFGMHEWPLSVRHMSLGCQAAAVSVMKSGRRLDACRDAADIAFS